MRHGKKHNHLGRQRGHRIALLRNLSIALITHKRIRTTLAKAKALRVHLEPIVTKSKTNTSHSRRVAFSYLQDKVATKELFDVISEKVANRPGGYLRIIKTGFRQGDGAEMAMIEFVDFNTVYSGQESSGSKKKSRRRGGKKSGGATEAKAAVAAAVATKADSEEE